MQAAEATDCAMQVLVVHPPEQRLPEGTADLLSNAGWDVTPICDYAAAATMACTGAVDLVILVAPEDHAADDRQRDHFDALLQVIDHQRIAGLVLTDAPTSMPAKVDSLIDMVERDVSLLELRGRLSIIERYHAMIKRLERELSDVQRVGERLHDHFREVDEEMRLAGSLQRDFLPDLSKPFGNVQFAASYWPASWVSGDIFDVFRVDDDTTGFYIADAVGHGMAAGLLTMFIKRAVMSQGTDGQKATIFSPSESMVALNAALVEQALPNCQFVTACYGLLCHRTCTLRLARGGHPYPLLIKGDGEIRELCIPGGLLGIFGDEQFPTLEISLRPGEKLLLYTDGAELLFKGEPSASRGSFADARHLPSWRDLLRTRPTCGVHELIEHIDSQLRHYSTTVHVRDDMTVLGFEMLPA